MDSLSRPDTFAVHAAYSPTLAYIKPSESSSNFFQEGGVMTMQVTRTVQV